MEALLVIGIPAALIAAGVGYLTWRDRRRGVSADDPASTAPPPGDADRHGLPGTHFQHGSSGGHGV